MMREQAYAARTYVRRETPSSSRIGYVDALKGFAILCVVVGHTATRYLRQAVYSDAKVLLCNIHDTIYLFHMPLFMMISGYVYYAAYFGGNGEPDRKRINRQVCNLAGIYVVFGIVCGFSKFFAGEAVVERVTLVDIVLIGIKPIDYMWYLYTLILLYLIFSIKRLAALNQWMIFSVLIMTAVTGKLIHIDWFSFSNLLYYPLFFFIGISCRKNRNWIMGNRVLTSVLFCASAVLYAAFWNRPMGSIPAVSITIALGIPLTLWYMFEHISLLGNCNFFKVLGRYSLEIYLMHNFTILPLERLFLMIGIDYVYVSFFLNVAVSTAAPIWISKLCCKRNNCGLFSKPYTYLCARHEGMVSQ